MDLGLLPTDTRPDYGSGPYLALVAAAIRLARHDLDDPKLSEGALAFLRSEPYMGKDVGIDVSLFGELIGFTGGFDG